MLALPFLVFMTLSFSRSAWAEDAAPEVGEILSLTPEARLKQAVRLYQTGNPEKAQTSLARLANDPGPIDESLRQQARLYLGEVLYLQQNKEEARRLFEAILQRDSDFVIDPFQHPPDVCGFFETVRAYMRPTVEPTTASVPAGPVPRTPASAYYGFGIYQMQHGKKRLGTVMAVGQTAMAVLSIASFGGLLDNRSWKNDNELQALRTKRAIQWSSTAGFYTFWAWGTVHASRHWRANVHLQPAGNGTGSGKNDTPRIHIGFTIPTR